MKQSVQWWLENLEDTLFEKALIHLHQALERFHTEENKLSDSDRQVASDYLTKSLSAILNYVAYQKSPLLLFRDLSIEWRLSMIQAGSSINFPVSREEELKLISGHYPRISLEKSLHLFECLYPCKKHQLKSYWQLLLTFRTREDSGLPVYTQRFQLEQFCFLALDVFHFLAEDGLLPLNAYKLSAKDQQFLRNYRENRIQRVERALQDPSNISATVPVWPNNPWNRYEYRCPSCSHSAQMFGFTELRQEGKHDLLTFYACLLQCPHCNLVLFDPAELLVAGCGNIIDISSQVDDWLNDHDISPSDETILQAD